MAIQLLIMCPTLPKVETLVDKLTHAAVLIILFTVGCYDSISIMCEVVAC